MDYRRSCLAHEHCIDGGDGLRIAASCKGSRHGKHTILSVLEAGQVLETEPV